MSAKKRSLVDSSSVIDLSTDKVETKRICAASGSSNNLTGTKLNVPKQCCGCWEELPKDSKLCTSYPCAHTVCTKCFELHKRAKNGMIICPMCNSKF